MATAAKIMVVDDEKQICENVEKILSKNNYEVIHATSAKDALTKMAKDSFSLVISDIVMPQMNGQELVERLIPLQPEMKVLFISGYSENVFTDRNTLDPGMSYVQKPFTPMELLGRVRHVLDSE